MKHTVIVRPEAEEDLKGAFSWYEDNRLGLGYDFLLQLLYPKYLLPIEFFQVSIIQECQLQLIQKKSRSQYNMKYISKLWENAA